MRLFRNAAAVFLFGAALSVGTPGRAASPPWFMLYCGGQHLYWGLEHVTNDCMDIAAWCTSWCGQYPYGYWCSSHGDGRTDGGCMCVANCA
jgi:hypothetical protein